VQLSTYGDSLGRDIKELKQFIDRNLQGLPPQDAVLWRGQAMLA
jgi:hypothetical protein